MTAEPEHISSASRHAQPAQWFCASGSKLQGDKNAKRDLHLVFLADASNKQHIVPVHAWTSTHGLASASNLAKALLSLLPADAFPGTSMRDICQAQMLLWRNILTAKTPSGSSCPSKGSSGEGLQIDGQHE